ncbi:sugar ABC transporter ATP-binding protein [Petrotoga sp. DB-2]
MQEDVLKITNVSKNYDGVQALKNIDFSLHKNEIHCLVGENGSGKSTLIKIISGVVQPDSGTITIKDKTFQSLTPQEAIEKGIQVIYQDLSLFPNLSVAENIFITQYQEKKINIVNYKKMKEQSFESMHILDVNIDPDKLVRDLPISQKQVVAIMRAIESGAEIIIMDEPTASLSKHEIDRLLNLIIRLKKKGFTILFVSHKLDEIRKISERVTILRDGEKIGTYEISEIDDNKMIYLMTGKKFDISNKSSKREKSNKLLEVKNLTKRKNYKDINFELYEGEILGITGVIGSGRTEVALSIFGMNTPDSGEIIFQGEKVNFRSNQEAIKAGISLVPEDRIGEGIILEQPIGDNIIITIFDKIVNKIGIIKKWLKENIVTEWIKKMKIKTENPNYPAKTLSGGNQQKVVIAKWLATNPKVLILDCPTIGIDIAAKYSIYKIIRELASNNLGIIFISDEVPEIYNNCDRIIVMKKGKILRELYPDETTEEELSQIIVGGEINV